jgi:endonuclease/exonuclease/phosphatase family metal-dependent hydrolase
MGDRSAVSVASTAVLFLFFLELAADFVAGIYGLNLLALSMGSGDIAALYLAAPEQAVEQVMIEVVKNVSAGLLLLSPLALLFLRARLPAMVTVVLADLTIACRIAEPLLPPRARMLVSGLGAACFLALFPLWIRQEVREDPERGSLRLGVGMSIALLLSILLRSAGRGVDLSLHGSFQVAGWVLGVTTAVLVPATLEPAGPPRQPGRPGRAGRATVLSLGIMCLVFLIYAVLSSPTVLARWTEGPYVAITAAAAAAAAAFTVLALARPGFLDRVPRWGLWLWNGAFVLALLLSVTVHQTGLPADPAAYPVAAPRTPAAAQAPLLAMLLLSPVVFVDLVSLFRELGRRPPSIRALGAGFSIGSLAFLLLVFAVIFTTIWDYVPGVGPLFRDRVHLVFLVAALAGTVPVLLAREADGAPAPLCAARARLLCVLAVAAVFAGAVAGAAVGEMPPGAPPASPDSIEVLTWNIQAGVDASGRYNFEGQLDVLLGERPDVIGLQESDTARITGGNTDVVRYLANRLGYHSYYGPKTVTGTFGIALLSRYPIEEPRTFYLWSEGEQTAAIEARIRVGEAALRVIVTHLGNYGPIDEQRDVLELVAGDGPLVLMGDFNFDASSEQYAMTAAVLEDCRRERGGEDIDHIFASPGTEVLEFRRIGGGNSDHPAALAVLRLPGIGRR